MTYFPLQIKTDYSLLESVTHADDIIDKLKKHNLPGAVIADNNSLSGCVSFLKEMKDANLKPILGCNLTITDFDLPIVVLAKNIDGWKSLIKLVSRRDPLNISDINDRNLIALDNNLNRDISDHFSKVYGLLDYSSYDVEQRRAKAKKLNIDCVASCNSHYIDKSQAQDQRILIAIETKKNIYELKFNKFFQSDEYYLPSYDEMKSRFSTQELNRTLEIAEICDTYNILSSPKMPNFDCPDDLHPDCYIRWLCLEGWRKKLEKKIPYEKQPKYNDRTEYELKVICEANLSTYFLIVRDIVKYTQEQGYQTGPARGSAAGCIVSYLIDITKINPLNYGLIFERFYNVARKGSLPDIDIDVPKAARPKVIEYLKDKYGDQNVAQIATYQTVQGRNALKSVLRANNTVSFEEMNSITKNIIDKNKIEDELKEMDEPSVIRYALEHKPERLSEWCHIDNDGNLQGPLAPEFAQSIKLEGVRITQSRHAAGVVISDKPLIETCPMTYDKNEKTWIANMEMQCLENLGLLKVDILGIAMLDKIMNIMKRLKNAA